MAIVTIDPSITQIIFLIFATVTGGTDMEPQITDGDILIIADESFAGVQITDVKVNDIVVFNEAEDGTTDSLELYIHRVVDIKQDNVTGYPILITKGDTAAAPVPQVDEVHVYEFWGKVAEVLDQDESNNNISGSPGAPESTTNDDNNSTPTTEERLQQLADARAMSTSVTLDPQQQIYE